MRKETVVGLTVSFVLLHLLLLFELKLRRVSFSFYNRQTKTTIVSASLTVDGEPRDLMRNYRMSVLGGKS